MPRLPRRTSPVTLPALALAVAATSVLLAPPADAQPGQRAGRPPGNPPAVATYGVPTPGAGLGRLAPAPDGSMWVAEGAAHKLARVTARGTAVEVALPSANPSPRLVDLDAAADGSLWVVYDSGRLMIQTDRNGRSVRPSGGAYGFADTVATSVRVAPDGVVWNLLTYPATGARSIARTFATGAPETPADGAPACDGALAAGSDGAMWCRAGDAVLRMANPPQGSATLASTPFLVGLGSTVADLAAGPAGSIWFSRTDASGGQVGYVDAATGAVRSFPTGAGSRPGDLAVGPDGRMWFVDGGTTPGIGWVDAEGHGGRETYGDRVPSALSFAADGSLWFSDATHDSLTRVARPGRAQATRVAAGKRGLRVRSGRVRVVLRCEATAINGCAGRLRLRSDAKVRRPGTASRGHLALTRPVAYTLTPGTRATVVLRLTRTGRAVVRRGVLRVRVQDGGAVLAEVRLGRR